MLHGDEKKHGGHHKPASPYISREEFDLYDAVKGMSALGLIFFMKMIAMGKCGKWAAKGKSSTWTKKMFKKSCWCFLALVILTICCAKQGKHILAIKEKAQGHHKPGPHHGPHHGRKEMPEEEQSFYGRNLGA
jgi:hypothetical protein